MSKLRILYHGTDADGAQAILNQGWFAEGTFFARGLRDALACGRSDDQILAMPHPAFPGCSILAPVDQTYIFAVVFEADELPSFDDNWWQWVTPEDVTVERVQKITCLTERVLRERDDLREQVFNSQQVPEGL